MKKLLGGILLAIGILIAGASGLCTLVVIGTSLAGPSSSGMAGVALLVGGFPCAIGVLLIWAGRAVMKSAD